MSYCIRNRDGFYCVTSEDSFEPIGGWFVRKLDALRGCALLSLLGDDSMVYRNRESIAARFESLRWDIRKYSEHRETRAAASGLRDIADIAQARLESVTRP